MLHNPYFNLFMLHSNSFDNQGSEIKKNDTVFYENFLPTTHSINVQLAIIVLALDFVRS